MWHARSRSINYVIFVISIKIFTVVTRRENHRQISNSSSQMKKVRREIRDLSASEWDAIVKALWIMKQTSDSYGKTLYGRHYISYDSMISKHMTAGNRPHQFFYLTNSCTSDNLLKCLD